MSPQNPARAYGVRGISVLCMQGAGVPRTIRIKRLRINVKPRNRALVWRTVNQNSLRSHRYPENHKEFLEFKSLITTTDTRKFAASTPSLIPTALEQFRLYPLKQGLCKSLPYRQPYHCKTIVKPSPIENHVRRPEKNTTADKRMTAEPAEVATRSARVVPKNTLCCRSI